MAIGGYTLISIPLEVQQLLKEKGWCRNSVSYGHIIKAAFTRIDELTLENSELKQKQKQIDDIQSQIARMATGLVGAMSTGVNDGDK